MRVEYCKHMGDDLAVVNAARVSFDKHRSKLDAGDDRLISYLARHDHWTPFAHPQVCIRITAPIFVARQWWRSVVGVARNEVSRRYVDHPPEYYTPETWRSRPRGNIKQGSGGPVSACRAACAALAYRAACGGAVLAYRAMLALGVAPEQARMVLPQSTMTTWIETGSLTYFARVCRQRLASDAQGEVQELAGQVQDVVQPLFPVCWSNMTTTEETTS